MLRVFLTSLALLLMPASSLAEITTKKQADDFLKDYCIEIVSDIHKAYDVQ